MSRGMIYLVYGDQKGVAAFTDKNDMLRFLRRKQAEGLPVVGSWNLVQAHDNPQDGDAVRAINLKQLLR